MSSEELCYLSATAAAAKLSSGELSSVELTEAAIERAGTLDSRLGAYLEHTYDDALNQARASDRRRAA